MWEQQPASGTHFQDAALMYDWNQVPPLTCQFERPEQVELNDETLRDGLQCPSVLQPTLEQKLALLRILPRLGIGSADIGYPGSSTAALEDVVALAKTIQAERLPVCPIAREKRTRRISRPFLRLNSAAVRR
jgi:isopropylmalate/homocitrate/citramalate synthase